MFRNCVALLIVTSCFLTVGCGDSHEKVTRDSINQMKKMVSILENVKSVEDAKAAKPKLEAIARSMKSIQARMKKLGDPGPELEKQLKAKFESEVTELMPKMLGVMLGMSAEVRKELDSTMGDMPKGL